jgi:hypothetical protein
MKRKLFITVVLTLFLYGMSYVWFRKSHTETWVADGHDYVIFPENLRWIYYFYRPAMYLDSAMTGMRFHIGPHASGIKDQSIQVNVALLSHFF